MSRRPYEPDPQATPELTKLERPGGAGLGGWRLAAGVLGVLLAGVVLAGRLGVEDAARLAPSLSATDLAVVTPAPPSASPEPTPSPSPQPTRRPTLDASLDSPPDVPRHLDGLPTSLGGEKVYRLEAALARAGDRPILVAGWYTGQDCLWAGRCVSRLADSPSADFRARGSVAVRGLPAGNRGPRVLRVTRHDECPVSGDLTDCNPVLTVLDVAWAGDLYTRSSPIEAGPLIAALKFAFPEMHPQPFRDVARCPVEWPPQTYRSTSGGPRMTVVFPTIEDRLALEQAIRTNWPQPASYHGVHCLDQFMDQGQPAGWIAEDNVMVWVSQDPYSVALARAAILDGRSQSQPAEMPVSRPLTTWTALTALRHWNAALDVLPPHDHVVWGPGIHLGGTGPLEAYAIDDAYVRRLLVFADPAERRAYERRVRPRDVIVLPAGLLTDVTVGRGLIENDRDEVRWLGYRNLLLQVSGPRRLDDQLRATLREAFR
ncbi:MAG TPA: hypothetical protein VMP67_08555 [Candidatus Limnocylindria bacterium]|nr:hypothetical protein [Candidatus Limnocylindria bacterium]